MNTIFNSPKPPKSTNSRPCEVVGSAATSHNRCGILRGENLGRVYVPGEGFVTWQDLAESAGRGSRHFWHVRAMRRSAQLTQAASLLASEAKHTNCGQVPASNHKEPTDARATFHEAIDA